MSGLIRKSLDTPDETRPFEGGTGQLEVVNSDGGAVGRATFQPGWKWSEHVGPVVGAARCSLEHAGMVVSGVATVEFEDGRVIELTPGNLFYVPPVPHDSWVVGDEPYVSIHLQGAQHYTK